jgi:hypothetical protein
MEDYRREPLINGERAVQLAIEDVGRTMLAKADEAMVGDCETAFNVCRTPRVGVLYRLFAVNQRVFDQSLSLLIANCSLSCRYQIAVS